MVTQFTGYRASDGTGHDNAYDAWKRELYIWLLAHGVDNTAIALSIIKAISDGRPDSFSDLAAIIEGLAASAPPAPDKAVAPRA